MTAKPIATIAERFAMTAKPIAILAERFAMAVRPTAMLAKPAINSGGNMASTTWPA